MEQIEASLGYVFQNKKLMEEALTHPSISQQETSKNLFNYERLEFLGDGVLGLVIAELLINKYPEEKEGHLAKRQAGLVRGESVAKVAMQLGIGRFIKMTQGEEFMGGRDNSSNMENTMEALIGAVYLDGGLAAAKDFIAKHWAALLEDMKEPPKDAKTALQEWAQGRGLPIPKYTTVNSKGPSHDPEFEVEVEVVGLAPVKAIGGSKKKAEMDAAQKMLDIAQGE
ncbi:MAG: rnc [Rickettsiaceae bacterium]|nr:rnc [Rickettsiaceae bacterium]